MKTNGLQLLEIRRATKKNVLKSMIRINVSSSSFEKQCSRVSCHVMMVFAFQLQVVYVKTLSDAVKLNKLVRHDQVYQIIVHIFVIQLIFLFAVPLSKC